MNYEKEIYDKLLAIAECQAAVKADTEGIKEHLKTLNGTVLTHTKQINRLESYKMYLSGIVFGVTVIISTIWAMIDKFKP